MRRIEFIAPVDAMRGNLSGTQDLAYAKNDNKAFDAPEGRQYARNYDPRYIGAKIIASGKKIFTVKTKSATKINAASLLRMALLGASGALYSAVLKNAAVLAQAEGVYAYFKSHGLTDGTFRQWLQGNLRMILENKMSAFIATASSSAGTFNLTIDNPWNKETGEPNCPVSNEVLAKFWMQLAQNAVSVTASGVTIVGRTGDRYVDIIESNYNVAGLSSVTLSGFEDKVVKLGDLFLCEDDNGDSGIQVLETFALIGSNVIRRYFSATPGKSQG